MFVIDAITGQLKFTFRRHISTITCISIYDTQLSAAVAVTGSYDGTVCVWDLKTYGHDCARLIDCRQLHVLSVLPVVAVACCCNA